MIKSFKRALRETSAGYGLAAFFTFILASIFPKWMDLGNPEHTIWFAIMLVFIVISYTIKFYKETKKKSK